MAHFGPLAGGLFLAGGAIASKVLAEAESKWAETSADMLMHLASDKASELFGSAAAGFRTGHNGDVEKSMAEGGARRRQPFTRKKPRPGSMTGSPTGSAT